jgi:hypothetical protein
VKDFQYYADKAEDMIARAERNGGRFSDEQVTNEIAKAQVYATLATAAPKMVRPPVYRGGDRHAAGAPMRDDD